MKIVCAALMSLALGMAEEPADRAAIGRVVDAINDYQNGAGGKSTRGLFTANAENELGRLSPLVQASKAPWSEVTGPRIIVQSVRFITSQVALVDGTSTQYSSIIPVQRVPVLFVMKKEAQEWRIASLRVLVDRKQLPDEPASGRRK